MVDAGGFLMIGAHGAFLKFMFECKFKRKIDFKKHKKALNTIFYFLNG